MHRRGELLAVLEALLIEPKWAAVIGTVDPLAKILRWLIEKISRWGRAIDLTIDRFYDVVVTNLKELFSVDITELFCSQPSI